MENDLPQRTRVYQNHHLDSTRWDSFVPRDDDIVIATPYKCGTTWMQGIVGGLILPEQEDPLDAAVWIDIRLPPLEEIMAQLAGQTHRRSIKTHLPLDGLPYHAQVKYIVVSRDVRDVFMSLWNHYSNYTPSFYEDINDATSRVGPPQPICPEEIREFWQMWITQGWFEWEGEGYPYWSNMRHVQTWWNFRHLPNILFVHYNHLKIDPANQIQRIAQYLDIPISAEAVPELVHATSLNTMREKAVAKDFLKDFFKEGAAGFFYKGTNNRWKEVLTSEDLELYEMAAERELSPDCRAWLEKGIY
jgi:aryl sulfotransferase